MKEVQDKDKTSLDETTLEKAFSKVITPFEEFIHRETTSGFLLMGCTIIALLVVNFGFNEQYQHLLHSNVGFNFGSWQLEKTLHHWINDGLMALFFFVVGLEIKREVLVGELSDMRAASLPIVAALGGMIIPAVVYAGVNIGGEGASGWGIPMATDIAFAVGVLVLLGSRAPKALMTFLVALAIVDDLGAVVVIALFYTETIHFTPLGIGAVIFVGLIAMNIVGIRSPLPYFLLGLLLWLAMLKSGVHATLAGVLTALTIPAKPKFETTQFSNLMRKTLDKFDSKHKPGVGLMRNEEQHSILQTLEDGVHAVETPLQRLEHSMHTPVAFLIIPIFALANAGIPIEVSGMGEAMTHPVTIGVMLGLILGKFLGITGFCYIAIKLGIAKLPQGISFSQIGGVAMLAGIGFTMSIFIAELAFVGQAEYLLMAKTGILFASIIAGVIGYLWLRAAGEPNKA
ncbi:Na+/H+ antiporter NhaA [Pseudomonadota bacterium]